MLSRVPGPLGRTAPVKDKKDKILVEILTEIGNTVRHIPLYVTQERFLEKKKEIKKENPKKSESYILRETYFRLAKEAREEWESLRQ